MTEIFHTLKAAAKAGGYAVKLFSGGKLFGVLAEIDSITQAEDLALHAGWLGADETEIISQHKQTATLDQGKRESAGWMCRSR